MSDQLILRIDLDRVAANLSATRGQPVTRSGAKEWLLENDFEPSEGNWIAEASVASMLGDDEVLEARSLVKLESEAGEVPPEAVAWLESYEPCAEKGS